MTPLRRCLMAFAKAAPGAEAVRAFERLHAAANYARITTPRTRAGEVILAACERTRTPVSSLYAPSNTPRESQDETETER